MQSDIDYAIDVLRAVQLFFTLFSSLSVRTVTSRCKFRFSAFSERKKIYYYYSVREMDAEMQNELDFKWKTRSLIYHSFQFLPQTSLGRSDVVFSSLAITPSSWQIFDTNCKSSSIRIYFSLLYIQHFYQHLERELLAHFTDEYLFTMIRIVTIVLVN